MGNVMNTILQMCSIGKKYKFSNEDKISVRDDTLSKLIVRENNIVKEYSEESIQKYEDAKRVFNMNYSVGSLSKVNTIEELKEIDIMLYWNLCISNAKLLKLTENPLNIVIHAIDGEKIIINTVDEIKDIISKYSESLTNRNTVLINIYQDILTKLEKQFFQRVVFDSFVSLGADCL